MAVKGDRRRLDGKQGERQRKKRQVEAICTE